MKRSLLSTIVYVLLGVFVFSILAGVFSSIFASTAHAEGALPPGVIIVESNPEAIRPQLGVVSTGDMPEFNAGSSATLTLPIKNSSQHNATNVKIAIEAGDSASFPFVFTKLNLSKTIDSISTNETKNAVFEFDVDPYASNGIYTFKLKYDYSNTLGNTYSTSEDIYIEIVNKNTPPKLTVSNITLNPQTVVPGEKVDLKFRVKNIGTLGAEDVRITLTGLRSDAFTVIGSTDVKYLTSIDAQKDSYVAYSLSSSGTIAGGNHLLEVKTEYKDKKGTAFTEVNQIFLPVGRSSEDKAAIGIENIIYPQSTLSSKNDFEISFDIVNNGDGIAENLKAFLTYEKEIYPKSANTIIINTLGKGERKKVSFKLSPILDPLPATMPDNVIKTYLIGLNVEFNEKQGDPTAKSSALQYVDVNIRSEKSLAEEEGGEGKSVPKIIIDKYSFEPSEIVAGQTFNLTMSFYNTNNTQDVGNVKVSVASDDGTFTPANSSSTFYIESIGAKGRIEKDIELLSKADAAPKSYTITVTFEYEDSKGTQLSAREVISIPVVQNPRLVTSDISMPYETYVGQPMPVFLEFYNMGKATLYNLMVKTEGDFDVQGAAYFVGNFEPGRSDMFDSTIVPNASGELKGAVVFSFEDAGGKQSEIRKEFTMNAIEMQFEKPIDGMPPDEFPQEGMQEEKFYKKPAFLIGIGAALLVALIVFIIIRKRAKTRKELMLDE